MSMINLSLSRQEIFHATAHSATFFDKNFETHRRIENELLMLYRKMQPLLKKKVHA